MGLSFCQDCKKRKRGVQIRQCDYRLCDDCENVRKGIAPKIIMPAELSPIAAAISTPSKLQESILNLQTMINEHTPQSNAHVITESNESSNITTPVCDNFSQLPSQTQPKKCSSPKCKAGSLDEPLCVCTVCSNEYHIVCAGLTKQPVRKWTCVDCRDVHSLTKNLQKMVISLQREMCNLKSEQFQLKKSHESLKSENSRLHEEVTNLKDELSKVKSKNDGSDDIASNDNEQAPGVSDFTFVIGDSILRDCDGVFENASVKSISGGTVSDVFQALNGRSDLNSYKNIVIHAGTNDISKNIPLDDTIESMEASITLIMVKAPTTQVHISAVCPRTKGSVQHKVDTLNAAFKELASRLDCSFIDSGEHMVYRNGSIDEAQFSDGLHLNERGRASLIKTFADSINTLKQVAVWSIVKTKHAKSNSRSIQNQRNHQRHRGSSLHSVSAHAVTKDHESNKSESRKSNVNPYPRNSTRRSKKQNNTNRSSSTNYSSNKSYSGCYNCGLKNHNKNTCFHRERLRCRNCNRLGHKSNYCKATNESHNKY